MNKISPNYLTVPEYSLPGFAELRVSFGQRLLLQTLVLFSFQAL